MAQKPVLRVEVGCACIAREVSVDILMALTEVFKVNFAFDMTFIASCFLKI